jgi:signal transduction histidine kinase
LDSRLRKPYSSFYRIRFSAGNDYGKRPQTALATDEFLLHVQRHHPGISARIADKMGFRSSFVSTVSGDQDRAMWTDNSPSERISIHPPVRYGLPVAAIAAILVVCHALTGFVGTTTLYILLFPVIVYSALSCGIGPSMLAVVIALGGAKYWFISPLHSFRVPDTEQLISMLAFLFASGAVVAMGEARRRQNQRLRNGQAELEVKVQEHTVEVETVNKSLRNLSARLLQLQDDERRRIARELHDSVGQLLAGLTMNLSAVRADIDRLNKTAAALTDSEAIVQEMTKEVRTISHLLHPPLLDEAGLASAVRWYIDGFAQRSNIKVDLDIPADFARFSPELETAIFRIVQECLTNIHRHSGSSIAKIRLVHLDGQVHVEVEDQGKGIPPEKQEAMASAGMPGVGIRGMRERIRQLGGTLEIRSNGAGTAVLARLPAIANSSVADVAPISETSTAAA